MAGDTTRIGVKRQIGSRNPGKDARTQVWDTILKREAAAMGHIHVCDACVAPCDDPEYQMVVPGLCGGLEHLKIETRLIDERFPGVMDECLMLTSKGHRRC